MLCKSATISVHVKRLKTTKSFLKNWCPEHCLLPKWGTWEGSSPGLRLRFSFLLSFRRIRTVMALSRRGRRPCFRPAELLGAPRLGGGWTGRQEHNAGKLSARAPQGEETRQDAARRAPVCGNRPPPPCPMETWRRCGTAHLLVRTPRGRGPQFGCAAERSCEGVAAIRGPGTRAGAEAQAAGAESGGERRRRRPWREGLAGGRRNRPESRAGGPRPAGAAGRPCSLGSQARPGPARRS